MANSPSARKRARQAEDNRRHNATQRSYVRTMIKRVVNAVQAGDKSAAEAAYREAVPAIDRSVSKGIMHANKAARHKSPCSSMASTNGYRTAPACASNGCARPRRPN